jgi:hypothetical protein
MTIFNGSLAVSSRFFLKSGSGVMTLFYLAIQLQRKETSKCN